MKHCSEVITHNILHLKNKQFETMFSLCCWAPQRKLPIYFISNKLMFKIQEFIMELSEISWVKGQKLSTSLDSDETVYRFIRHSLEIYTHLYTILHL